MTQQKSVLMTSKRKKYEKKDFLNKLIVWRISKISEKNFIYLLSLLLGILTGLAALLMKKLIHFVEFIILDWLPANTFNFLYLVLPLVGITLTFLFVKYYVREDINHGITKILYSISRKRGKIKRHHTYTSMVASSLTIACGGSVGAEAPIVLTGAAIGSNLARIFNLNYKYVTLMIGCGAAGAIAGIFKAPVAGVVFTLEVLMLDMTMAYLLPLLISSVTAASLSYAFMGHAMLMEFRLVNSFAVHNIGYYVLLGVFSAIVSVYLIRAVMWQEKKYKQISNPYVRLIGGGIMLSLLIFLIPPLWGEGYAGISRIFSGNGLELLNNSLFYEWRGNGFLYLLFLLIILLFKVVATALTTGSGGIGGIFAPTLFMGAIAGFSLAKALNLLFNLNLPEENFALAGMAGVMAGVMHAPLTAIFLTAEITGGYQLFIPLIITSTVSYLAIMPFEPYSIYAKRLALKRQLITHDKDKAVLMLMQTRNLVETDFEILKPEATLRDLTVAISRSHRNIFPVVDKEGMLRGMVKLDDIRSLIFKTELYDKLKIMEIMYMPQYFVSPYNSMEEVAAKFESSGRYNLAVIDNGKYVGFISRANVFSNYRDNIRHFSSE